MSASHARDLPYFAGDYGERAAVLARRCRVAWVVVLGAVVVLTPALTAYGKNSPDRLSTQVSTDALVLAFVGGYVALGLFAVDLQRRKEAGRVLRLDRHLMTVSTPAGDVVEFDLRQARAAVLLAGGLPGADAGTRWTQSYASGHSLMHHRQVPDEPSRLFTRRRDVFAAFRFHFLGIGAARADVPVASRLRGFVPLHPLLVWHPDDGDAAVPVELCDVSKRTLRDRDQILSLADAAQRNPDSRSQHAAGQLRTVARWSRLPYIEAAGTHAIPATPFNHPAQPTPVYKGEPAPELELVEPPSWPFR